MKINKNIMKERLDQFTVSQFIDIACGDYSHLGVGGDAAKQIAVNLMEQYNNVADPASAMSRLLEEERFAKNEVRIKLYRILLNLINAYGAYDEVRSLLATAGLANITNREDESLKAKIEQMLRTEESLRKRMEEERRFNLLQGMSEEDFRASFDQQTARLMAHFKFSISHETVSASVYANLVNTACRQHRQQRS